MSGKVRLLRIAPQVGQQSSIDTIANPQMLAHQLMDLNSLVEYREYTRRLRLSGIAEVCVREQLLGLRNNISMKGVVDLGLRVTYDIGNALHDFLQNATGYLGAKRLGWWRCSACGFKYFGKPSMSKCAKCSALPTAFRYKEHALKVPDDVPVSGHPDNFLEISPGDIRVVDFKSINGDDFDKLTGPKAEHAIQVIGYMEYLQMDETIPIQVNPNRGFVLYISKKHAAKSLPFKVFHVERSKNFVDLIHRKVADFKRGLEDDAYLPAPLPRCAAVDFKTGRAKACPVVSFCSQLCTRVQLGDEDAISVTL